MTYTILVYKWYTVCNTVVGQWSLPQLVRFKIKEVLNDGFVVKVTLFSATSSTSDGTCEVYGLYKCRACVVSGLCNCKIGHMQCPDYTCATSKIGHVYGVDYAIGQVHCLDYSATRRNMWSVRIIQVQDLCSLWIIQDWTCIESGLCKCRDQMGVNSDIYWFISVMFSRETALLTHTKGKKFADLARFTFT